MGSHFVLSRPISVVPPPTPPPGAEAAVTEVNRYSGNATSYQPLVSWTVSAGKTGYLRQVSMACATTPTNTYPKTHFKLTIAGVVQFAGKLILAPLVLTYPDLRLDAGATVLLEVKSTDGTAITVDGEIAGKEVS